MLDVHRQIIQTMSTDSTQIFLRDLASKLDKDELNDVSFVFNNDDKDSEKEAIIKANRGLLSIFSPVFKLISNHASP